MPVYVKPHTALITLDLTWKRQLDAPEWVVMGRAGRT